MFFNQSALDPYLGGSLFTGYEILVMHFAHQIFEYQADALYTFRGLEILTTTSSEGARRNWNKPRIQVPLGFARVDI